MMQFIARKKLEESEKKKKKYQRKAESFRGVEDAVSLLNKSNIRIKKLEECNERLRSYINDLQVYCKELIAWTRESLETNSKQNHEQVYDANMTYDDIAYWYPTNLNSDLGTKVDDEEDILNRLKVNCQARRLES